VMVTAERMVEILMVEDNAGDVRLAQEALRDGRVRNRMNVVRDGVEGLAFLRQEGAYADSPKPDIILLDLNMPRMGGLELMEIVKQDNDLKRIPIVVLTTSSAEEDILRSYNLHANCYITKPVDFDQFMRVIGTIESFWLNIVQLPPE
jgi:chemotaxis family two-component system response regulator Rcp1